MPLVEEICSVMIFCGTLLGYNDPVRIVSCEEEKICLKETAGQVIRKERDLILNFRDTSVQPLVFTDNDIDDADKYEMHKIIKYIPDRDLFVIANHYYESYMYWVIRGDNGLKVSLEEEPQFSPNGRNFSSVVPLCRMDESEYDIRIWTLEGNNINQKFNYPDSGASPRFDWKFDGWDGNDRLKLKVSAACSEAERKHETQAIKHGQNWLLDVPKIK